MITVQEGKGKKMASNIVYLQDCMDGMRDTPDKYYDLAIVDPVYGDVTQGGYMKNLDSTTNLAKPIKYHLGIWNQKKTGKDYFEELFRISKNQIIWGGNYFVTLINRDSQGWIVWDKQRTGGFADCELAWTSFNKATRIFKFRWNGMFQENMKEKESRIHPTQKPVALYAWLLNNYAKPGDKILDTHVGSGSSRIAAYDMGYDFTGYEIDPVYWEAQEKRFKEHTQQINLFIDEVGETA